MASKNRTQRKKDQRERVLSSAEGYCVLAGPNCEVFATTVDHWIPKCRGGGNASSNLRPACYQCNQDKGDMMPEEWWAYVDFQVEGREEPLSTMIEVPLHLQEALSMSTKSEPEEEKVTVTEVEVDSRGRVSLKSTGLAPGRYRVTVAGNSATLDRVFSYTETELLALQSSKVAEARKDYRNGTLKTVTPKDLP